MAAIVDTVIPYATEIVTALVSAAVAVGVMVNKQRRDNSKTTLQEKTDKISADFMQNIMDDHHRVVAQLKEAEAIRATNAEKIGALTAEVNHLREQISEVRGLLREMSVKLDAANTSIHDLQRQLNEKDGHIIKVTAEKEAAIARAKECEGVLSKCKKCDGPCFGPYVGPHASPVSGG